MANTEDFDGPDIEPDLNQDADFADFEDDKKSQSFADTIKKNPLIKFGIIGAGVVLVIAMVSMFGGKKEEAPDSHVAASQKNFKDAPGQKELTPEMKDAMEDKNRQRVEEAQKTGTSAIVTPIAPPKNLLEAPQEQSTTDDPLLRWKQMQEERVRIQREQQQQEVAIQQNPQTEEKMKATAQAMANQFGIILGKIPGQEVRTMTVTSVPAIRKPQQGTMDSSGATMVSADPNNPYAGAPKAPPKVIIPAGQIDYAQTMIEANSDVPGPVLAMLVSGPFAGARLIGTFSKMNEYLVIRFSTLVTKKGTSIPIQAYAINPDTSLTAVATDVDHRYLQRIILPAAAKFVEGMGSAIAETATTTSQSSSSTTTSSSELDTKQQLGKAFEESSGVVSEILKEDGDKVEILVVVKAGTPIGIMFTQQVTDQLIKTSIQGPQPDQQANQSGLLNPYDLTGAQQNQNGNLSPLQQLQRSLLSQQGLLAGQSGQNGFFGSGTNAQQGGFGATDTNTGSTAGTEQQGF